MTDVRVSVVWSRQMAMKKTSKVSQPKHVMIIEKDIEITMRDGVGAAPYTHYSADYNTGTNTIYTGGNTASYILLPVIPSQPRRK